MKDLPTSFSCPILQDLPNENHKTNYTNAKEVLEELELAGKEIRLRFQCEAPRWRGSVKDPLNSTYLIDIDASKKFRSHMRDRCPCITKSRPSGRLGGGFFIPASMFQVLDLIASSAHD